MPNITYAYDGSNWRLISEWYGRDGTTWRKAKFVYCHDGSAWRLVYGNDWVSMAVASSQTNCIDTDGTYIYVGQGPSSGQIQRIGADDSITNIGGGSLSVVCVGSDIYSIGLSGTYKVYKYNVSTWDELAGLTPSSSFNILRTDGTYAYTFNSSGTLHYWDGASWVAAGPTSVDRSYQYLLGAWYQFRSAGAPNYKLSYWNGASWSDVGTQTWTGYDNVFVHSGNIHVTTNAGVYTWDGSSWTTVGSLGDCQCGASLNGVLSAMTTTTYYVKTWDGSTWNQVGSSPNSRRKSNAVLCNSTIYLAGGDAFAGLYKWPKLWQ